MRIGIVADVHGNEEALSAVLAAIQAVDQLVCLGDVVGYGASPEPCIQMLRDAGAETILGNHELGLLGTLELSWFNDLARAALEWQRTQLSRESLGWVASLRQTLTFEDVLLVHGTPPSSPTRYTVTAFDVERSMPFSSRRICLVGHSHLPGLFVLSAGSDPRGPAKWKKRSAHANATFHYENTDRVLINPGSVGQPRDGCPLAAFAILDTFRREITFHRVPYSVGEAQRKIEKAGLPGYLAERLALGH